MPPPPDTTRVMAAGVFDLLHPGHIHYLEQAAQHGDELVVVIARDASVQERKHPPILPEETRRTLVQALKPVDEAVLGDEEDQLATVERLQPDIIALGHDDYHDEEDIKTACKRRGVEVSVVRVDEHEDDLAGTREILRRISRSERYRSYLSDLQEDPS